MTLLSFLLISFVYTFESPLLLFYISNMRILERHVACHFDLSLSLMFPLLLALALSSWTPSYGWDGIYLMTNILR